MQMWQPIAATRILGDQEGVAAREALLEPEGEVTKKMRVMETLVTARTTAFYCGDDVSLADIHLFCVLGFLRSGCVHHCVSASSAHLSFTKLLLPTLFTINTSSDVFCL